MLSFPEDYFKDEKRSGFLVSEMMKRTWGAQLEIFDRVKNLCDKLGIKYYAEVGTILGAVRHGGIIPWDDDIDIAMLREDYNKLLEHGNELGDDLCLRSIYSSETFFQFHAVATHKADILEWDDERMKRNHECPFICSVDIFPLDYYPQEPKKFEVFRQLYNFSYSVLYDLVDYENRNFGGKLQTYEQLADSSEVKELFDRIDLLKGFILNHLGKSISINENVSLRNQLAKITDMIAQSNGKNNSAGVEYAPKLPLGIYGCRPIECYKSRTELPFECTTIMVPSGYQEVLRAIYGENYMTPVFNGAGHDYPFFKHEVNVLVGGDIGERYVLSGEKKFILESLDILQESRGQLIELMKNNNLEAAFGILEQMQSLAVEIGNYVEKICDDSSVITDALTEYCEEVYLIYQSLQNEELELEYEQGPEVFIAFKEGIDKALLETRRSVFRQVHGDIPDRYHNMHQPVLIGVSATGVVNASSREIDGIKSLIEKLLEESRTLVIAVSKGLNEFLEKTELTVSDLYHRFLDEMDKNPMVDVIEDPSSKDIDALLAVCDRYYGDDCKLSDLCINAGMETNVFCFNWE